MWIDPFQGIAPGTRLQKSGELTIPDSGRKMFKPINLLDLRFLNLWL